MKDVKTFDVIIVGAGPSGGLLGYYLSKKGVKVLIIEKKKLPRYKPCGGGLTKRVLDFLPFDISELVEDYSYTAKIFVQKKLVFCKTVNDPIIAMVMRDKFDFFLVKKAMKAGAYLNDQTNFISLSGTTGNLDVETTKGNFKTKIIVGADGVNSNVAKAIQLNVKKKQMMAIEAEVFLNNPETLKELQHSVHFDLGMIPGGYGWVFPKRDHLSIGMLSVSKQARDIKRFFKAYLESKAIHAHADIRSLKGHMIPYGPAKSNSYANKNGMLVGDATGFVDPITGEGIYYAFREAQIAAEIISDDVLSINESAEKYNTLLKKELMHDLDCAQKLAYILYKIPVVSHRVLKAHGKSIGENHLEIITGKKSYGELFNEVLSLSGIRTLLTIRSKQQSRMQ